MFVLPATWEETKDLLMGILLFTDHAPFIYVAGPDGVRQLDFKALCASMPDQLYTFLRTGLGTAWHAPVQIHGPQADWLLLPCGVLPSRPEDFVLKWNVRALNQEPLWALNHPGFAAFFPALVHVQKQQGRLETFVWQHIWQLATAAFFHGDAWQQMQQLQAFCAVETMVNVRWIFKEDNLLQMLSPTQKDAYRRQNIVFESDQPAAVKLTNIIIDGYISLPPMACCKRQTGCGNNAGFFCTACTQLYCESCANGSEHVGHVFKVCQ